MSVDLNGSPIGSIFFSGSGRVYLDRNLWRGFNNVYGGGYHQISQAFGSGAAPAINAGTANGYVVPKDGVLKQFALRTRCNSAEAADYEYVLILLSGGTASVVSTLLDNSQNALSVFLTDTIGVSVLEGDVLVLAARKVGGSGTRRYGHASWSIVVQ